MKKSKFFIKNISIFILFLAILSLNCKLTLAGGLSSEMSPPQALQMLKSPNWTQIEPRYKEDQKEVIQALKDLLAGRGPAKPGEISPRDRNILEEMISIFEERASKLPHRPIVEDIKKDMIKPIQEQIDKINNRLDKIEDKLNKKNDNSDIEAESYQSPVESNIANKNNIRFAANGVLESINNLNIEQEIGNKIDKIDRRIYNALQEILKRIEKIEKLTE